MDSESESFKSLAAKVAVVTGAGSAGGGIGNGRACAIRLADCGARVAIVEVDPSRAAATLAMIHERGGEAFIASADVTVEDEVRALTDQVLRRWGRIDVLVNNVGIAGPPGTVEEVDLASWHECFQVNVTSMLLMSRFSIPAMRESGGGSIINMSSVAGLRGFSGAVAYSTTKGAIVALTQSMALAHGPDAIRVNVVAPGLVHTPMVATQGVDEAGRARRAAATPLGTEGTGWDVADAVEFLASSRARWITGTVLPVDGGLIGTTMLNVPSAGGLARPLLGH